MSGLARADGRAQEKLAVLRPGYDRYDSAGERPGGAS